MFGWLKPPRRSGNPSQSRRADRHAGFYSTQDPYGSALDAFDEKFEFGEFEQAGTPKRNRWRFWLRDKKIETPRFGERWQIKWWQPDYWRGRRKRWWAVRIIASLLALFIALFAWLAVTAPLSKSLEPIAPPQITLLASDGTPIARSGAVVEAPVQANELPAHVVEAFLAIEDRRFYDHWGIDPRGLARAAWSNMTGGPTQGGSTITQQLAKFTFLTPEQTLTRKAREMLIAFWLETWLTKDEILERYLSNAYFGDNQYGLRAASLHYFYRQPENLQPEQAAMLAGLLKAPSRLAPTRNYDLAKERLDVVIASMVAAGYITEEKARSFRAPKLDVRVKNTLPTGTYFADWALPIARQDSELSYAKQTISTTLDARLQGIASRAVARAPLRDAQVALVAMRPNGEVVAMVGGKDYAKSPFNRATQAQRQPGSTFKLFVYLAAIRAGLDPDDRIDNTPIEEGSYRPRNVGDRYSESITLRQAFARSSNVAAVRLYYQLGDDAVIKAARDLGVTSNLPAGDPSLALGTTTMSLLELTSAYAGIAANSFPVEPHAFPREEGGWFDWLVDGKSSLPDSDHADLEQMLRSAINDGTGRAAMLAGPNFGKTGTTQDNRDALFVGYAGDLIVGVWVGNDDNSPLDGVTGGGLPARIWRNFMQQALAGTDAVGPDSLPDPEGPIQPMDVPNVDDIPLDGVLFEGEDARLLLRDGEVVLSTELGDIPLDIEVEDGNLRIDPQRFEDAFDDIARIRRTE
jgi:penicillin-binding protein 1A